MREIRVQQVRVARKTFVLDGPFFCTVEIMATAGRKGRTLGETNCEDVIILRLDY